MGALFSKNRLYTLPSTLARNILYRLIVCLSASENPSVA